MAFQPRALSRYATSDRGRSGRSNAYVYSTEDALEAVLAAGYFDAARTRFNLKVGDMIECAAAVKGTPASALLQVASIAGTAVTMAVAAGGAALGLSSTRFLKGTASGATIAAVTAQPGWVVSVLANNGVSVSLDADNRTVKAAAAFGAVANGSIKFRAVSADGRNAVERTFDLSVVESDTPPVQPPIAALAEALTVLTFGDSFGQRVHDVVGAPNDFDTAMVNPVTTRWADDTTNRVGGVIWGAGAWLGPVSGGKYDLPYGLNRATGGSNSGQSVADGGKLRTPNQDRLSILKDRISTWKASGRKLDALFLPLGTNDMVTNFTVDQSLNNVRTIVRVARDAGLKTVMHTILPRGLEATAGTASSQMIDASAPPGAASNPNGTLTENRRPFGDAFNAGLKAMADEAEFKGWLAVADAFAEFQDPAGRAWAVKPGLTYNELHLSAVGNAILSAKILAALDKLFPSAVADNLAKAGDALGLFAGTGGTLGAGFTGQVADGWSVVNHTQFANVNVAGTKAASVIAGVVGNDQVLDISANSQNATDNRSVGFGLERSVAIPANVAVGDYFQVGVEVEIANPVQYRGADLELVVTEGGMARTTRTIQQPPSNPGQNDFHTLTANPGKHVLWTTPRKRTADMTASVTMRAAFFWAGRQTNIGGKVSVRRPTIRKASGVG